MRALCFRAAKMQAVGCKRASLPTANRTDSDDRTAYSRAVFFCFSVRVKKEGCPTYNVTSIYGEGIGENSKIPR